MRILTKLFLYFKYFLSLINLHIASAILHVYNLITFRMMWRSLWYYQDKYIHCIINCKSIVLIRVGYIHLRCPFRHDLFWSFWYSFIALIESQHSQLILYHTFIYISFYTTGPEDYYMSSNTKSLLFTKILMLIQLYFPRKQWYKIKGRQFGRLLTQNLNMI